MDQSMSESDTRIDAGRNKLVEIVLDPKSLGRASANIEHEREVAIFDLLDGNAFTITDLDEGPYKLFLTLSDDRLEMIVTASSGADIPAAHSRHQIALTPLKRIMKDYFLVCESYYQAVRSAPPAKIQAIDVSRRALHDEGSAVLRDKLLPAIVVDGDTARRLFTLVCSLHWKG